MSNNVIISQERSGNMNERFKEFRKEVLKKTQVELAEELGIARASITNWERGDNVIPEYIINLLESKYGMSKEWLITGAGEPIEQNELEELLVGFQDEMKILLRQLSEIDNPKEIKAINDFIFRHIKK